ncbi:DUF1624 domain-containing protein [Rhizobium sp. ARZ01]|uniref:heparan-alpha-glucosaminide N-acetyltransferase n=1 Tax=Rhizobium sp. ARZ01 TaxID=2769313 RepID=UPI001FEE4061|nr:DUF1624 domain-containing protein [Rhizobium sp. ARZ01]
MALVAMAIYHFTWDLDYFGYIAPGTAATGGWKVFARLIAGSFIFLAGFSLVLGHRTEIRWRSFWIRFSRIVAAALLITIATYFIFPGSFIFFGILHSIAAASLLGLLFLRLPVLVMLVCSAAAFAAPHFLRSAFFDQPALWWVGLSQTAPRSNDYVPLLPWFGAFLLGMAASRIFLTRRSPVSTGPRQAVDGRWISLLATAGRHSLAIYLLHQPALIALVYLFTFVMPPAKPDPVESYKQSCVAACGVDRDATFCRTFCDCTLDRLLQGELFNGLNDGTINARTDARIADISQQCTADAYSGIELKE